MRPSWRSITDSLREVALAETEEQCLRRIAEQSQLLFGAQRLDLSTDPGRGSADDRLLLTAEAEVLGHFVLAPGTTPTPDEAEMMSAFAGHAGLILKRIRQLEVFQHHSRRDPLTGLRNYREFSEMLTELLPGIDGPPQPVGVVVIDMDRFKEVNDRYGHAAGDRLLRATAAALSGVCRAGDGAFRIGGDEFALVLPGADAEQATSVAKRAHRSVTRLAGSHGASWGVAAAPADGVNRDELMAAADSAMYKRKRNGSTPEIVTGHTRRRLSMVARLTTKLTGAEDIATIAATAVDELHESFGYYLAVVQRLDEDEVLRVVACAGPLASSDYLAWEQSINTGVNGRVARTRQTAVVPNTRADPDYLSYDMRADPGSEVSVPIMLRDEVWGVLNIEQIAAFGFDDSDIYLAETVAAVTASAIHRYVTIEELTEDPDLS